MSRRGPKIGDAVSLWNFAPSPGFTKDEAHILKICLMALGVGRWVQILDTGLLSGKLIQQLNGQTQRLLGQQSLAAFTGLHLDLDQIRADNDKNKEGERKGGLLINSGPNPTKELRDKWRKEAKEKYGLTEEEKQECEKLLETWKKEKQEKKLRDTLHSWRPLDVESMDRGKLLGVLGKMRTNLKELHKCVPKDSSDAPTTAVAIKEEKDEEKENDKPNQKQKREIKLGGSKRRKTSKGASDNRIVTEDLESIIAMGFNKSQATKALQAGNYELEQAVGWLMNNVA
jgi:hypothetical protein